jgi:hypothetical protein
MPLNDDEDDEEDFSVLGLRELRLLRKRFESKVFVVK